MRTPWWKPGYAKARADGDRTVRTKAFDAMAAREWELAPVVWRETDLLLWKPFRRDARPVAPAGNHP
ncbi:hypothetical protein OG413_39380 [Streptomyces sp. NBC_01433]|uniref:hypothetical protein n=1 Tax=Streptomyces sp. NBC_01433 TaxID=2903864 RepID=UPI0022585890|nr:hypothetical protein [Streptomyces sp. NBC_01433]MCX4681263.1 hypothetical protein [Streptomyces sp. NBC_01433]